MLYSGTTADADVSALAPGSYSVKVAAVLPGQTGPYSDPAAFQIPGGGWTQVSTAGPPPMADPVVLSYKGQLWEMAGQLASVYSSPDGRAWTQASGNAPWGDRLGAAGVVYLGKMLLMGGAFGAGAKNDVWSSEDGSNWTQVTSAAPWRPRLGLCAVVFQGRMWVFGGADTGGNVFNDVWSSANGVSWPNVTQAAAWSPRTGAAAVVFNGRIWMMGGSTDFSQGVWSTADGINWEQAAAPPWIPRSRAARRSSAAASTCSAAGGQALFDTWVTDDGQHWSQLESNGAWARTTMGVVVQDNFIYMVGGTLTREKTPGRSGLTSRPSPSGPATAPSSSPTSPTSSATSSTRRCRPPV